jgi:hypothetical protein
MSLLAKLLRRNKIHDETYPLRQQVWEAQFALRIAINELVNKTGEDFIPWAPAISAKHLSGARVFSSRYELIQSLETSGIAIEVGTQFGGFAKFLLDSKKFDKVMAIDIDLSQLNLELFKSSEPIEFLQGDSAHLLSKIAPETIDLIYIDASHSYENFIKDLTASRKLVKRGGYIVCNDYTVWSPGEAEFYGVLRGVHELLQQDEFSVYGIGLQGQGYHDIAIRKY